MRKMINYHDHRMKELSELEEAIGYLEVVVEEYRHDGDTFGFLTGLRNVIEAQGGVKEFIRRTGIDPRDWLKVLSSNDRQDLNTLEAVLNDLGDRLSGVKPENNSLDVKYTDTLNRLVPVIDQPNPHLNDRELYGKLSHEQV